MYVDTSEVAADGGALQGFKDNKQLLFCVLGLSFKYSTQGHGDVK